MESGHAYGKALRTVKSCVGETWCRYGVQDSVTMAIRLEERYRGLRAPHKLKLAVSGCTRECAEAQSKDVGVIATERGWNLYVAGNGGKTPRHATLLATDLDDEGLVRAVDRFLAYYVRTADRLQRTSTWFEALQATEAELERTQPGVKFVYGETGWPDGGPMPPHRTHRNGMSVDFMVPVRDKDQFPQAVKTKIILEIAGVTPPEPLVKPAQMDSARDEAAEP